MRRRSSASEEERSAYRSPDELVSEVQARLPRGIAVWDPEVAETSSWTTPGAGKAGGQHRVSSQADAVSCPAWRTPGQRAGRAQRWQHHAGRRPPVRQRPVPAAMSPHGVLASATGGYSADTDAGVEFGQQGLGDQNDAAMALGQSWDRALMGRAAGIGQDDGVA